MPRFKIQCEFCQRWLEVPPEIVRYYLIAQRPPFCQRCFIEAERELVGHVFVLRTPEKILVHKVGGDIVEVPRL